MTQSRVPRKPLPTQPAEVTGRPSLQRRGHDRIVRLEKTIVDAGGGIGRPWHVEDTLGIMVGAGSIDFAMKQAGERFHDEFRRAALDPLYAADPARIPVQLNTARVWAGGRGSERSRMAVIAALEAVGGLHSPGGSCAWHV